MAETEATVANTSAASVATQHALENALLAAKLRGKISLKDYAKVNAAAQTADEAALKSMIEKLNEDLPKTGQNPVPPTSATIRLLRHTLSEAARFGTIQPALVAQYQQRMNNPYTEQNYLDLIEELESKLTHRK